MAEEYSFPEGIHDACELALSRGYLGKRLSELVKDEIFDGTQDIFCCFCKRTLSRTEASIEHVTPKSEADYVIKNHLDNLAISCKRCNSERAVADFHLFKRYAQSNSKFDPPEGCKEYSKQKKLEQLTIHTVGVIYNMYTDDGKTVAEIADKLNISKKTVKRVLYAYGVI